MIILRPVNEVYIKVICDDSTSMELSEHFTFMVPGYKFMPKYRAGIWDGKIRLFNRRSQVLYAGLADEVKKFAEDRGYEVDVETQGAENYSLTEAKKDIAELALTLEPRDYQVEGVTHCVRKRRALLLSPTASGKSLMIYLLCRIIGLKTLIVVPTVNLVTQTEEAFHKYGYNKEIHIIYSGKDKQTSDDICITTWQSIYKMPQSWLDQFGMVIVDEAHTAKAASLTAILEKMPSVKYRFGFTGTLDDLPTNILVITGLFGPVKRLTSSAKLMEQGHIAPLKIKAILLDYSDVVKKVMAAANYQDEIDFIVTNPARNRFIKNLALSLKGNTLILFQFVEKHGKVLYDSFSGCGRNTYYASGETDGETRNLIRSIIAKETNCIFVASSGTFSTGADIPEIDNIIFASPSKSKIRVLQSIGRGLRNALGKLHCTLYDIADDLSWKKKQNHTLRHFIERVKIYAAESFVYKLYRVKIKT